LVDSLEGSERRIEFGDGEERVTLEYGLRQM